MTSAAGLRSMTSAAGLGATMASLYSARFHLIPLGGDDGKHPMQRSWHEGKRLPLALVEQIMRKRGSYCYGIRLDGLLVVDLDTDNDATRVYCDRRFGPTPLVVTTGRGEHRYYRYNGPSISPVREPGIAIDFKAGKSMFVVGPGSLRPDGKSYRIASGDFTVPAPWFVDRGISRRLPTPPVVGKPVAVGSRHPTLLKKAVEYCHCVDSFDELLADLMALRDLQFEDAGSVSDDEVIKVARWTWRKRAEGKLYAGRNSEVRVNRMALDALLPRRDGQDALSLYMLLLSNHGHIPGKVFAIVPDAMIEAGLVAMSRRSLYRAIKVLIDECLIDCVRKARTSPVGKQPAQYRLLSPLVAQTIRESRGRKDREEGGKASVILVSPVAHGLGATA